MKVVFDSGIIMNLDHLPEMTGEFYTTQLAIDEIKSTQARYLLELFLLKYRVSIVTPDATYIDHTTTSDVIEWSNSFQRYRDYFGISTALALLAIIIRKGIKKYN